MPSAGYWMSGNSSLCSRTSAASPNATMASITATVTIGRLMEKSEMSIVGASAGGGRTADAHDASRRDAGRAADQHRVAAREAGDDRHGALVDGGGARLDHHAPQAAAHEPQHLGPGAGAAHRRRRHHQHPP